MSAVGERMPPVCTFCGEMLLLLVLLLVGPCMARTLAGEVINGHCDLDSVEMSPCPRSA